MVKKKVKKIPIKLNNFLFKEINFSFQKVVSFSQFSMYQQCAHKWASQYLRKVISTPPSIHFTFGTSMHQLLQQYLKTMYEISGAAADRLDLDKMFEEYYIADYQKQLASNKDTHFSTPEELREFYNDGLEIIHWFKKNRRKYFYTKGTYLVGIEMPIQKEIKPNIIFNGSIDLVLYDERDNKITIFDFKTSTKGWNDYNKKDDTKLSQILLYKSYFSELYGFPIENINVEFMILKRKIESNEYQEFPKRIQTFSPPAGKIKIKQALNNFDLFINDCFDSDGKIIEKDYIKSPSKLCLYCPCYGTKNCDVKI